MICRLYTPHIGGVERHVAGISKEAIKEGHTVDVFTLKHEPTLATSETIDGVRVHRMKISGDWIPAYAGMTQKILERVVLWTWMLRHIWIFIRADVIQIHDVFYWYWPIRLLLPWKKVCITYHGFEAGSLPTEKAKRTRQMIQRWTNGSMAIGSWIEKWYGTKPDVISYGGADCQQQLNDSRLCLPNGQAESNSKKLKCVFVGRISEDTGAKVYQKVIGSLDNCHLDMYGEGSKLGTIENTCMVFPKYDIACVSSYLAIIEAMQSKTLVVAYAADDLKYDYLMAHPRAREMIIVRGSQELSDFFTTYSPEKCAANVESAYTWARQQTWNRVYLKYKKLWQSK